MSFGTTQYKVQVKKQEDMNSLSIIFGTALGYGRGQTKPQKRDGFFQFQTNKQVKRNNFGFILGRPF